MEYTNNINEHESQPLVNERVPSRNRRDGVRNHAVVVDAVPLSSTAFLIPPDEDDDRVSQSRPQSSHKHKIKYSSLRESSRGVNTRALSVSSAVVSPLSSNEGKQTVASNNSSSKVPPILPFPEKAEESSRESFQKFSNVSLGIGCAVLNKESRSVHKRILEFNKLEERLKFLEALNEAKGPEGLQHRSIESNENEAVPLRKRFKVAKDDDTIAQDESIVEKATDDVKSNEASMQTKAQQQQHHPSLHSSSLTSDHLKERLSREGVILHEHANRMRNLSELLRLYQETGELIARELDTMTR